LNVSDFGYGEKLPNCGRPENDSVAGFANLNRVSLTAEEIAVLYGKVEYFSRHGIELVRVHEKRVRQLPPSRIAAN